MLQEFPADIEARPAETKPVVDRVGSLCQPPFKSRHIPHLAIRLQESAQDQFGCLAQRENERRSFEWLGAFLGLGFYFLGFLLAQNPLLEQRVDERL